MNVTFLGTGTSQGIPVVACQCDVCTKGKKKDHRLRTSMLIEVDRQFINIDAGPDFRCQMLREKVRKLDAILITHCHKDHIAGLDDVRSFNYLSKKPMNIYAMERDQKAIKNEFAYAFGENRYPGVPEFNMHTIGQKPFKIESTKVIPLPALHMQMEILGFRIGGFSYVTDANYLPGSTLALMLGSKIVVLNALRKRKHPSHYNLEEAIKVLKFLHPERAYLTHISHLMGFYAQVKKELPPFIHLAYDGLTIEI